MTSIISIGVGAGVASAVLALVLSTGSLLALVLFFLAPLPIAIAALGWNHKAGLVGALVASILLAFIVHPRMGLVLGLSTFAPAWLFSFLALLARPAPPPSQGEEWYPTGRVLAWVAGVVAVITVAGIASISMDYAAYARAFQPAIELLERINPEFFSSIPLEQRADARADLARMAAAIAPPISAAVSVLITSALLVLAGRLVFASGRLPRPWPHLPGVVLPKALLPILAASFAGSFMDGFAGLVIRTLFAALAAAYALQGLAVIHALTAGRFGRGIMLALTYMLAIAGWPLALIALTGVADALLNIRARRGLTPLQGT
ncbi:MAG: DUF2232 domain-containing protein [Beijerinckiaceae bacterium]